MEVKYAEYINKFREYVKRALIAFALHFSAIKKANKKQAIACFFVIYNSQQ